MAYTVWTSRYVHNKQNVSMRWLMYLIKGVHGFVIVLVVQVSYYIAKALEQQLTLLNSLHGLLHYAKGG